MGLNAAEKKRLSELLAEKNDRIAYNRILSFEPYDYQHRFYAAGSQFQHRLLMAANRIGKSYGGAAEVSYHATGDYPFWWTGLRFDHPVRIICGGQTTERTRDIVQKELVGEPTDESAFGTGAIPRNRIVDRTRRAGIPDAISSILVKHASGGNSKIMFNSYEAGKKAWMGDNAHFVWLDEEPPQDIYSQALRAMVDLDGHMIMTYTPENGMTEICRKYMHEIQPHQFLLRATWDDAPHITEKVRKQYFADFLPHERDMRMKGLPMVGEGLVFCIDDNMIKTNPFEIPDYFRRIGGIDFGYDHPSAWVNLAYDPESDIIYVVEATKVRQTVIPEVCSILRKKGADKMWVAWPHDGLKHDPFSGKTIRDQHEAEGMKMLQDKFTNPPSPGMEEGTGGIGIEAGIAAILTRMETGRFKVFTTCTEWFEEKQLYHRKNGKIVDKFDDIMSATRYASQSIRFAKPMNQTYGAFMPKISDFADPEVAY